MNNDRTVTLCGEQLSQVRHVCAFFDSRQEQYETLMPYFKEGLDVGEEVLTIFESSKHGEFYDNLRAAGLPIDEAIGSGQWKVLASEDTYTKNGAFAADRMFTMLEEALKDAETGPFGSVRACGDMEWALKNVPGTDELMVYEARVNLLTPKYNCTLLCAYDINRFSGRAIADVLATHSHVILNGRIVKNPHYVEPLAMLHELIHRKKRPLAKDGTMSDRVYGMTHEHRHIPVTAMGEAAHTTIA